MTRKNGHAQKRGRRKGYVRHDDPRRLSRAARALTQAEYAVPDLPSRAGYCNACRVIRLSREDYGGLCMFCRADLKKQAASIL